MNSIDSAIYFDIMASKNALQALDALISNSSLSTHEDGFHFDKIVQFLDANINYSNFFYA